MIIESPLGPLGLVAAGGALVRIELEPGLFTCAVDDDPVAAAAARQLEEYFAGWRTTFDLPLQARGTPFQRAVWDALAAIPYGETRSYVEIARVVGAPSAARAVGAANAANPLPIVVPCHRVIAAGGRLSGYAGGVARKKWLLEHELTSSRPARTEISAP